MDALCNFFKTYQKGFAAIKSQEETVYSIFANAIKSETFTFGISTMNNAVNSAYFNIGNVFDVAVRANDDFANTMSNTYTNLNAYSKF